MTVECRDLVERRTTMTDPAIPVEPTNQNGNGRRPPGVPFSDVGFAHSSAMDDARVACRSLVGFGSWAGWGLVVVGLLSGALRWPKRLTKGCQLRRRGRRAGLRFAIEVMVFVLAGWGVRALTRITAAWVLEVSSALPLFRTVFGFVMLGDWLCWNVSPRSWKRGTWPLRVPPAAFERARAMAEIVRAMRAAEWAEAETRLGEFEVEFPGDPELAQLKDELAKAREGMVRESLARLVAAREVNDPGRVLDLYQELVPSLEDPHRASLDKDLAAWFLSLIHRRLRTGKVQADVVQLAARFADNFAATVEGASVLASLPTLRRSVGLCPRCAEPYTGVADACPSCKKSAQASLAPVSSHADTNLPE